MMSRPMNEAELRLAVHLQFTMEMDADHAGCPFSDEDSALAAVSSMAGSRRNWLTFLNIADMAGVIVPPDFAWGDHGELL